MSKELARRLGNKMMVEKHNQWVKEYWEDQGKLADIRAAEEAHRQQQERQNAMNLFDRVTNPGLDPEAALRNLAIIQTRQAEEAARAQGRQYTGSQQAQQNRQMAQQMADQMAANTGMDVGFFLAQNQDPKEKEYDAAANYYRNQRENLEAQRTTEANLAEMGKWTKEERDALMYYAINRFNTEMAPEGVPVGAQAYQNLIPVMDKYGQKRVMEIAESFTRNQNAIHAEDLRERGAQWADSGFLGAIGNSAATVAANAIGTVSAPLGYLQEMATRTGQYRTLDPNNMGNLPSVYSGAVRNTVAENIRGEGGALRAVGAVTYQGLMSAADNVARIYMAGGSGLAAGGLAAMGSFGSTVSEASANGADPTQAVLLGVASAGLEMVTEKFSIDRFLRSANSAAGVRALLKEAAKSGAIEVSEEELSFLGNLAAEALILRERSSYNQQIGELVANGMSYQQAKEQADRAIWNEAVNTAATSFISGGFMEAGKQLGAAQQERAGFRQELAGDIRAMMERESNPEANASTAEATASNQEAEYLDRAAEVIGREKQEPEKPRGYTDQQLREAMAEMYPREQSDQERLEELEAEMQRMIDSEEYTTEAGRDRYMALSEEWNRLANLETDRADSLENEEAPPERAIPASVGANESISGNPLAGRTEESVASRSVKAYQFEHPEVKPYFQDAARGILSDINSSMPGQRTFNEELHYQSGGERGWSGNKRITTDDLADLKDTYGYTWDELREAAEDIIHDRGRENNAASKRLEFMIHDRLANGYTDVEGRPIPANREYLDFLEERQVNEYRREGVDDLLRNADRYAPEGAPEGFEAMGAASRGFSPKYAMIDQYGALPEGENPVRADQLPASTTGDDRVSLTARTALEAEATPDEFAELIENTTMRGGFSYIPITNNDTVQRAAEEIAAEGWDRSRGRWEQQVRNGVTGADITATGALLYNHAVNAGDFEAAMDILLDYQQAVRNAAQAVQAARILKTLTPDNRLYMIRRSIERMVADMHLDRPITIDNNLAQQYQQAQTDAEADRILDAIARDVARQIPSTWAERFTALRYLNMLGNFRTQARNWLGNVTNEGLYLAKDELAATLEALASFVSGGRFQRSKTLARDRGTRRAAAADYENVADWISGGGRTNDRGSESDDFARRVQENRRIFRNPLLEGYRNITNWAMNNDRFGDAAFGRANYARALAGYLNARGIRTNDLSTVDPQTLNAAREYAVRQAQEATFRDNNLVSNAVSRLLRHNDTPWGLRMIGEAIMPFRKTPANVLVRAEEFSPLGLINSVMRSAQAAAGRTQLTENRGAIGRWATRGAQLTGADVVDSWAKSLTGTGIFAIGWALANMGFLRGGPDEDEDKAAFDKLNGMQDYAIMLPDGTNLTIDAFSPTALPLLLGAQLDKVLDGTELTFADLEGMLSTLSDPMIEMSMLSGLNDTIDAIRYADNSLGQFLVNAGFNYLTQALGNTLLGQIERSTEGSRMTTYIDKDSNVPPWLQRNLGKLSQKIPIWDYNQTEYIDQWGREQRNPEGIKGWLYNLLSPSYIDKAEVDAVAQELYRLNEIQTDVNVFPQSPETRISYTDTDGNRHEDYNLTMEETDRLKRTEGQTQAKLVADLIGSQDYNALTDAQKANAVKLCYDYARELARGEVLPGYDGKSTWMEGIEGKEAAAIIGKVAGAELSDAFTALTTGWREGYADDSGSLEALESAAKVYEAMSPEMQEAVREGVSGRVGAYLDARAAGMDDDTFAGLYRKYWDIDQSGAGATEQAQKWAYELERAAERREITPQQKTVLKESLQFFQNFPAETEKFDQLTESGLSADQADDLGWLLKGLEVQDGYKDVRDIQKAEAIGNSTGLSEADKIAALKIYGSDAQDENLDQMLDLGYSARDYINAWKLITAEKEKGGNGTKNRTVKALAQMYGISTAKATEIYEVWYPKSK